jgi:hypothetical protein
MSTTELTTPDQPAEGRTEQQKTAGLRRALARQLVLELGVPLAGYYGLRAVGASEWLALSVGSLLTAPWIVHGAVHSRRLDVTAAFTLSLMLMSGF